jgi:hypothetical protein
MSSRTCPPSTRCRGFAPPSTLIVLTARPRGPTPQSTPPAPGALDELALPPLSVREVALVLERLAPRVAADDATIDLIAGLTGGLPLLVRHAALELARSVGTLDLLTLPRTLGALSADIVRELSSGPTQTRGARSRILELLAVAREPLDVHALVRLCELEGDPVSLDELRDHVEAMSPALLEAPAGAFRLFHATLVEHVRVERMGRARAATVEALFARWCEAQPAAFGTAYALKHRVRHWLSAGNVERALAILDDPSELGRRISAGHVFDVVGELEALGSDRASALRRHAHFLTRNPGAAGAVLGLDDASRVNVLSTARAAEVRDAEAFVLRGHEGRGAVGRRLRRRRAARVGVGGWHPSSLGHDDRAPRPHRGGARAEASARGRVLARRATLAVRHRRRGRARLRSQRARSCSRSGRARRSGASPIRPTARGSSRALELERSTCGITAASTSRGGRSGGVVTGRRRPAGRRPRGPRARRGGRVVVTDGRGAAVWSVEGLPDTPWSLAWTEPADALAAACGDGALRIWDAGGALVREVEVADDRLYALAAARDKRGFVFAGRRGVVYRAASDALERPARAPTRGGWVNDVAVSPDGALAFAGHSDGSVRAVRLGSLEGLAAVESSAQVVACSEGRRARGRGLPRRDGQALVVEGLGPLTSPKPWSRSLASRSVPPTSLRSPSRGTARCSPPRGRDGAAAVFRVSNLLGAAGQTQGSGAALGARSLHQRSGLRALWRPRGDWVERPHRQAVERLRRAAGRARRAGRQRRGGARRAEWGAGLRADALGRPALLPHARRLRRRGRAAPGEPLRPRARRRSALARDVDARPARRGVDLATLPFVLERAVSTDEGLAFAGAGRRRADPALAQKRDGQLRASRLHVQHDARIRRLALGGSRRRSPSGMPPRTKAPPRHHRDDPCDLTVRGRSAVVDLLLARACDPAGWRRTRRCPASTGARPPPACAAGAREDEPEREGERALHAATGRGAVLGEGLTGSSGDDEREGRGGEHGAHGHGLCYLDAKGPTRCSLARFLDGSWGRGRWIDARGGPISHLSWWIVLPGSRLPPAD